MLLCRGCRAADAGAEADGEEPPMRASDSPLAAAPSGHPPWPRCEAAAEPGRGGGGGGTPLPSAEGAGRGGLGGAFGSLTGPKEGARSSGPGAAPGAQLALGPQAGEPSPRRGGERASRAPAVVEAEAEVPQGPGRGATDVDDRTFRELRLGTDVASTVQQTWRLFLEELGSREAAADALYQAVLASTPGPQWQALFRTPGVVMAVRLLVGLDGLVRALRSPAELKALVGALGFRHLDLEVTANRVALFRDAVVELLQVELGERLDAKAAMGWRALLNYAGGAYICVAREAAESIRIVQSSWAAAGGSAQVGKLALRGPDAELAG